MVERPYKIPSGSLLTVCTTSDFFIEGADIMRLHAWDFIHERYDCLFHTVTKRPERIKQSLPDIWFDGWNNVVISVTVENEEQAWRRIPVLLDLPIKHKGIVMEPLLEQVDISPFLSSGEIETVVVGGESYVGYDGLARELRMPWVKDIQSQCKDYNTNFMFHQTGSRFVLDNNKPIYVQKRDEGNLADFYKLDYIDDSVGDWKTTIEEVRDKHIMESAFKIYKQMTLQDLGVDILPKSGKE